MERYFPADVSLRVSGDLADAQQLFPAAKQLLFKALRMQGAGGELPVKLFMPGTDGSVVEVFLHQGLKIVYVQPGTRPARVTAKEEGLGGLITTACPDMLSGLVYPGNAVLLPKENPGDPDIYSVHAFHPTQISSAVYGLGFAFQDVERLAVDNDTSVYPFGLQVSYPKPSLYSGAMKRVVQALYGIGKTVANPMPDEPAVAVEAQNQYDYHWDRSHGIVKVDGVSWVIEISKERGILATPLPLFLCTEATAAALAEIGDAETRAVIAEFGGLPTGETFPKNRPLDTPPTFALGDAVTAGTVLLLATAEDVRPFYYNEQYKVDKEGLFSSCGWAFSETTGEAVNTCHWYSAATGEAFRTCELWQVKITLIKVLNTTQGSATITKLESGLFFGAYGTGTDNPVLYVPRDDLSQPLDRMGMFANNEIANLHDQNSAVLIAPITAFYVGDALEVVRFRPDSGIRNVDTTLSGFKDLQSILYYEQYIDPSYHHPLATAVEQPEYGSCPEWFDWLFNDFASSPKNNGVLFSGDPDSCLNGRPTWRPVFTYAYYFTASNGWVAIDDFAVLGWTYGGVVPPGSTLEAAYGVGAKRYDLNFTPYYNPVGDGFTAWLSASWKYQYQVMDRPRAFYGTSLSVYPDWEMRVEPNTGIYDAPGTYAGGVEVRLTPGLRETAGVDIGLALPAGVREGYVLLRALKRYTHVPTVRGQAFLDHGTYPNGHNTEADIYDHVEAKAFFADVGIVLLDVLGGLTLPQPLYGYTDLTSSGAVPSATTFRYSEWWLQEWRFADLATPIFHASIAAGSSKNYIANKTVYSFSTKLVTQSVFVENVACGMSAVDPRDVTFVGAV